MYKIFKNDETIAYVETPTYIKLHENGSYVLSDLDNAEGIAVNGTPYHLLGKPDMKGTEETAMITEVDSGNIIKNQQTELDVMITNILEA